MNIFKNSKWLIVYKSHMDVLTHNLEIIGKYQDRLSCTYKRNDMKKLGVDEILYNHPNCLMPIEIMTIKIKD